MHAAPEVPMMASQRGADGAARLKDITSKLSKDELLKRMKVRERHS